MKWLLLAILLPIAFTVCSQPKALEYVNLQDFRIHNMDLNNSTATIVLSLKFYNPNNYSISIKDGMLDTYVEGKYLSKALLNEKTLVPARDTFILPVALTASLLTIFSNALELLSNPDKEVLIRLDGSIRAGKAGIYFKVPIYYEGRQQIHF